ncbi:MAG TPA: undecaprenyl-diphosphate phosphatase [Syntrophorhabdales bacterium]|nr:undecaprenyl-diphosphate phosphatase [Syntrophorhabdales bacterium]
MDFLHAIIFGIVEGITEFLPISSTGHLILTAQVMGLGQTEFLKTFEISIQLGAILSVVLLYWRSLLLDMEIAKRVITAFLPTAVLGLLFYKIIKRYLLASTQVVLWSLFLGGLFLIVFEIIHRRSEEHIDDLASIPYPTALLIGLFQSVAMVPGVSRAAATIVGGLILGLKRRTIVEFSFLLAVPTMLAATCLDLYKNATSFSAGQMGFLLVGFVVSFIAALLGVKFLLTFIKHHTFISFGIYRIVIALLFWTFLLIR